MNIETNTKDRELYSMDAHCGKAASASAASGFASIEYSPLAFGMGKMAMGMGKMAMGMGKMAMSIGKIPFARVEMAMGMGKMAMGMGKMSMRLASLDSSGTSESRDETLGYRM